MKYINHIISIILSILVVGVVVYAEVSGGLTLPAGGLGITTASPGAILVGSTVNRLTSTTSPTVAYITATSSTATSTFQGAVITALGSGSLGVGTANPTTLFSVGSASQFQVNSLGSILSISGTTNAFLTSSQLALINAGGNVAVSNNTGATNSNLQLAAGTGTGSQLLFYTVNLQRMVIDGSGNVGIGTTTPGTGSAGSRVDIVGGNLGIDGSYLIGQGQGYANGAGAASSATLKIYDGATGSTILNNVTYNIKLQTNGTDKLTILNAGNVGIGTTTPGTTLAVSGRLNVEDFVNSSYFNATSTTASTTLKNLLFTQGQATGLTTGTLTGTTICLTGDICRTTWPTGGASTLAFNPLNAQWFNATGTQASLFPIVGISTSTPWGTLSVSATSSLSNLPVFVVSTSTATASTTAFMVSSQGLVGVGSTSTPGFQFAEEGTASIGIGTVASLQTFANGFTGFSSTTPWGLVSIQSTSTQSNIPVFAIATTSSTGTTTAVLVTSRGQLSVGSSTPSNSFNVVLEGRVSMAGLTISGSTQTSTLCASAGGEVFAENTTCALSTKRVKNSIETLNINALDEVMAMRPISFLYNLTGNKLLDSRGAELGFLAEELAKIDPRLVDFGTDGLPRNLRTDNIVSVVVKAIQQLIAKVTGLEQRLNDQDARIKVLEAKIK